MIRHAVSQDAQAIFRIRTAAIQELAASRYSEEQIRAWQSGASPDAFDAPIAGQVVLVEELTDGITGFAQLNVDTSFIERIYVSPLYARQGTGTRLLHELEVVARERGVTRLSIDATLNAVPFYQSAGYVAGKLCEHELRGGIVFPCMAMVKELSLAHIEH